MKTHRFVRNCVVSACGLMLLAQVAQAGQIDGSDTGTFLNPTKAGSTVTGVGTSAFTYGDARNYGTGPNSLTYSPANPIISVTETPFKLGTLTYFNGSTALGSNPTSIDLAISLNLTQPGVVGRNFTFTLNLESTPNTGTPNLNADYVFFPSSYSSSVFTSDGETYTLRLLGFSNVVGDGFLASDSSQLHVRERGTATADLMAEITTNLKPVPEPASLVSAGIAGLLGLGRLWSRRRKA